MSNHKFDVYDSNHKHVTIQENKLPGSSVGNCDAYDSSRLFSIHNKKQLSTQKN